MALYRFTLSISTVLSYSDCVIQFLLECVFRSLCKALAEPTAALMASNFLAYLIGNEPDWAWKEPQGRIAPPANPSVAMHFCISVSDFLIHSISRFSGAIRLVRTVLDHWSSIIKHPYFCEKKAENKKHVWIEWLKSKLLHLQIFKTRNCINGVIWEIFPSLLTFRH